MCQTENKSGRVGKEIRNNTSKIFNAKLKRESFTVAELEDIAEAAGVTFEKKFCVG